MQLASYVQFEQLYSCSSKYILLSKVKYILLSATKKMIKMLT